MGHESNRDAMQLLPHTNVRMIATPFLSLSLKLRGLRPATYDSESAASKNQVDIGNMVGGEIPRYDRDV